MKILPALAFVVLTLPALAQTQAEMNQRAIDDYRKADAKLSVVYGKVRAALDEEGQEKLKTAQKAWIAYRDAEAALEADTQARGGTMAPLIFYTARQQLTEERTAALEKLLKPDDAQSGDAKKEDAETDARGNATTAEQNPADNPTQ